MDIDKLKMLLSVCPDAEYGCSQCEFRNSLYCRMDLMREAAGVINKQQSQLNEWGKYSSFLAAHGILETTDEKDN